MAPLRTTLAALEILLPATDHLPLADHKLKPLDERLLDERRDCSRNERNRGRTCPMSASFRSEGDEGERTVGDERGRDNLVLSLDVGVKKLEEEERVGRGFPSVEVGDLSFMSDWTRESACRSLPRLTG
jgi:hypothetical protein